MPEPFRYAAVPLASSFENVPDEGNRTGDWIGPLSRLNVLVGPNNSGKSRLLRTLLQPPSNARHILVRPTSQSELETELVSLKSFLMRCGGGAAELVERISELEAAAFRLDAWTEHAKEEDIRHRRRMEAGKHLFNYLAGDALGMRVPTKLSVELTDILARTRAAYSAWQASAGSLVDCLCVYVPCVRTLRLLPGQNPAGVATGSDEDRWRDPLSNLATQDYGIVSGSPREVQRGLRIQTRVLSGQSLYAEIQRRLLGTFQERSWIGDYERYLSERFFSGASVSLIPRIGETLHIKIGDAAERPIAQLGDGLQQIITLTYPYMLNPAQNTLMFVEEPELYLHPGFQRALIEAWLDFAPKATDQGASGSLQVFVATHSSQFLDMTLDRRGISVFRCAAKLKSGGGKECDTKVLVTRVGHDARCVLEDLGMRNSAVLLCNCTIWVEGITDRMYLRHWLDLYWGRPGAGSEQRHYLEDVHFAFVEYGGGNITHWSFLDRSDQPKGIDPKTLCGELFLIADRDNPKGAKSERHERLKDALGNRYWRLSVREIENLLTPATIANVVYAGDTKPVPRPSFSHEDYKKESLGAFIDNHVPEQREPGVLYRSRKYSTDSGTIRDKRSFAERAIHAISTWDELSSEARELVEAVAAFIKKHNP